MFQLFVAGDIKPKLLHKFGKVFFDSPFTTTIDKNFINCFVKNIKYKTEVESVQLGKTLNFEIRFWSFLL